MIGDNLIGGLITLTIAATIGFFAVDFYSAISATSLAIETGSLYATTQQNILASAANVLPWFVGGGTLVLGVLVQLTRDR